MQKEDRRTKITKQMLKQSLLELLKTDSIHHIKIRELCEHADVNRSTFYKYYASQYELLQDMENDWLRSMEHYLGSITPDQEAFFADMLVSLEENLELSRLLLNSNVDADFPRKLFERPYIKQRIDEVIPLANKDDSEVEYVYRFYVNGGYSIIKHWLNKEQREPTEEIARIMQHIFKNIQYK